MPVLRKSIPKGQISFVDRHTASFDDETAGRLSARWETYNGVLPIFTYAKACGSLGCSPDEARILYLGEVVKEDNAERAWSSVIETREGNRFDSSEFERYGFIPINRLHQLLDVIYTKQDSEELTSAIISKVHFG